MNQKLEIIYREISIHKTLIHPNIIRLYSFKEDSNSFFFNNGICKKRKFI